MNKQNQNQANPPAIASAKESPCRSAAHNLCKKLFFLLTSLALAVSMMVCASAANERIDIYLDGYCGADGEKINFDVPPQTINSRTMVPIRAIFEAMGATVVWDDNTKTAICTKDSTVVKMTLNSTTEYINGVARTMDVPPVIINGRTLAPARYVAEAFDYYVSWDNATRSVLISKNQDYTILDVTDGSKAHPFKLGTTISFKFFDYNSESHEYDITGICTLTLKSLLSPDQIKEKEETNVFSSNDLWCIVGHIKLDEYTDDGTCSHSDMIESSSAVTSKLREMGNYLWYESLSPFDYSFDLYSGGETDCYIPIHKEKLVEGETVEYFTVTYRSGQSYKDKKTVWFSLK